MTKFFLEIISLIIIILIIVGIIYCIHSGSNDIWNNGICPDCGVYYQLRGVSKNWNHYFCPECGQRVTRFSIWFMK